MSISFAAAYLGGLLTLFAPCAALILPSFFAYAFTDRTTLLGRTFWFTLGLLVALAPLGFLAGSLGHLVREHESTLTLSIGGLIMVLGAWQALALPGPKSWFKGLRGFRGGAAVSGSAGSAGASGSGKVGRVGLVTDVALGATANLGYASSSAAGASANTIPTDSVPAAAADTANTDANHTPSIPAAATTATNSGPSHTSSVPAAAAKNTRSTDPNHTPSIPATATTPNTRSRKITTSSSSSRLAVFSLGVGYGLAGVGCSGPILGAMLALSGLGGSALSGGFLMMFYGLGMATPIFLLSLLWERFRLGERGWLKPKPVKILGRWTTRGAIISGVIFIVLGVVLILTGGRSSLPALLSPTAQADLEQQISNATAAVPAPLFVLLLVAIVALIWALRWQRKQQRKPKH